LRRYLAIMHGENWESGSDCGQAKSHPIDEVTDAGIDDVK